MLENIFEWLPFEIINPTTQAVIEAVAVVALKDAPILAAAKAASVDALVTLDKRHILDQPELEKFISALILRPKEAYDWIMTEENG